MAMNPFEELLKEARKRARLSQQALADKVGVDDSYISKMENGVDKPPSREKAVKLADALGLRRKSRRRLEFLLAAGVTSEEDLEGFALVKIEDGETEEEDKAAGGKEPGGERPTIQKPTQLTVASSEVLAATGTFGAPSSLEDDQEQQLPTFEDQARQIITSYHLPYAKQMIAQQMSLEAIRIICWGLKEAED